MVDAQRGYMGFEEVGRHVGCIDTGVTAVAVAAVAAAESALDYRPGEWEGRVGIDVDSHRQEKRVGCLS